MKCALLPLALAATLSSCTYTYNATHSHNHPSEAELATLSPKMRKLAREQMQAPLWTMFGDMALMGIGFEAGPLTHDETLNLAGFAVTGLVFASLGASILKWGHL